MEMNRRKKGSIRIKGKRNERMEREREEERGEREGGERERERKIRKPKSTKGKQFKVIYKLIDISRDKKRLVIKRKLL